MPTEQIPTGLVKRGSIWWIDVTHAGRRIRKSTKTPSLARARMALSDLRESLHGSIRQRIVDQVRHDLSPDWLSEYQEIVESGYARRKYQRMKAGAKMRGIPFHLELEDLTELVLKSNGRCALTGIKLVTDGGERNPYRLSVDRIDASDHYHAGNCRIVAYCVNLAIAEFGESVLEQMCIGYAIKTMTKKLDTNCTQNF